MPGRSGCEVFPITVAALKKTRGGRRTPSLGSLQGGHLLEASRMKYAKRPDPTPEEIVARAAEIREAWSDADFQRRAKITPSGPVELYDKWMPPVVAEPDLR